MRLLHCKWLRQVRQTPNSDSLIIRTSKTKVLSPSFYISYCTIFVSLTLPIHNLISHPSIQNIHPAFFSAVGNLRGLVHVPGSTADSLVVYYLVGYSIVWVSRIKDGKSFILASCEKDGRVCCTPFHFVYGLLVMF